MQKGGIDQTAFGWHEYSTKALYEASAIFPTNHVLEQLSEKSVSGTCEAYDLRIPVGTL